MPPRNKRSFLRQLKLILRHALAPKELGAFIFSKLALDKGIYVCYTLPNKTVDVGVKAEGRPYREPVQLEYGLVLIA